MVVQQHFCKFEKNVCDVYKLCLFNFKSIFLRTVWQFSFTQPLITYSVGKYGSYVVKIVTILSKQTKW